MTLMEQTLTFVPQAAGVLVAATRRGVRRYNMDASSTFRASTGVVTASVVDGIGNDRSGPPVMKLMADNGCRIGATRGPLAGVLAAAAVIEDPGVEDYHPDGVMVLAVATPGEDTEIGWVGDSHIHSWDGKKWVLRTSPHTMGAYLRQNGDSGRAVKHDNWVRVTLSTATATNVAVASVPAGEPLLLLSDGLDEVSPAKLAKLFRKHGDDHQAFVTALVGSTSKDKKGYRDDATAVLLVPPV
ncbi:hypothetical protein [Saccharothrix sp. HUAS TT1]|uniref:hypothetical protein n=1 Tax=unclassified Saccharothrix TaxID=2593673 RepID=UPI00345BD154